LFDLTTIQYLYKYKMVIKKSYFYICKENKLKNIEDDIR